MTNALDGAALLEKHNPILVLFPHEPDKRSRPGTWHPGEPGWGDYHPCNVEFFLAHAHFREQKSAFDIASPLRPWSRLARTGVGAIRASLAADAEGGRSDWELDVAEVPSQNEMVAWSTYRSLLREAESEEYRYRCVAYGRFVPGPPAALQYWYLYIYNDFRNNHEADWEMVTIELSPQGEPVQAGYSSHAGGSKRPWLELEREGDRPVVHVALGSHAGYFRYRQSGYTPLDLIHRSNLPAPLEWGVSSLRMPLGLLSRLPRIRRWRDLAPADPETDARAGAEDIGVRVCPELRVVPDDIDQPPDSDWWWLRYRGKWGSTRPRMAGTVGIDSPWAGGKRDKRWRDPIAWLKSCRRDKPQ